MDKGRVTWGDILMFVALFVVAVALCMVLAGCVALPPPGGTYEQMCEYIGFDAERIDVSPEGCSAFWFHQVSRKVWCRAWFRGGVLRVNINTGRMTVSGTATVVE